MYGLVLLPRISVVSVRSVEFIIFELVQEAECWHSAYVYLFTGLVFKSRKDSLFNFIYLIVLP